MVESAKEPTRKVIFWWKRALDLLLCVPALIILFPVLLVIAVAIRLDSPGDSLFRQDRVGQGGRTFNLLKFRSMRTGTPELSTADMSKQSVRHITRLGGMLRRFSLDELPQLLNVLRGDMSLVGPRPALPSQTYLNEQRRQSGVEAALPGITGWAQINGRDDLSDDEKVAHDAYYVRNCSLGLDIIILIRTFLPVLKGQGNK